MSKVAIKEVMKKIHVKKVKPILRESSRLTGSACKPFVPPSLD